MSLFKCLFLLLPITLILSSCSNNGVGKIFGNKSPYEKYVEKLNKADLHQTALGKDWLIAGNTALSDSILIEIPFSEVGYFSEEKIRAVSYNLSLKRGEVVAVRVNWFPREQGDLFVDLFKVETSNNELVASIDSTYSLKYEVNDDSKYILRLQPELLRSGKYSVEINRNPSLAFPIPFKDSRTVGSFFGAKRDGGKRKHEGVDIFVPKKTPVIAVAKGIITSVSTNQLGGKVVFLNDASRNYTFYYAHLDSQLVDFGEKVEIGDTIGLVGNTGNARYTPPHLHFGIYTWGKGAIDPLPFIAENKGGVPLITGKDKFLGSEAIVKDNKALVFKQLSTNSLPYQDLPKNSLLKITGLSGRYYRVELPDGLSGYVRANQITEIGEGKVMMADASKEIFDFPDEKASVKNFINEKDKYFVLGKYKNYLYVKYKESKGWILNV